MLVNAMPRRRIRLLLALAATAAALTGGAQLLPSASASTTLPAVDMEAVLKAAQWDPAKSGTSVVTGAGPSVKLVESALQSRGLLDASYVDGHFGTRTLTAYAKWQQSLGYTGLDASGLPGRSSLAKLGDGRFTLARVVSVGARTTHQGYAMNTRTLAMLKAAQTRSGLTFEVEQGSYSAGVDPTSAGTHDGGGTLDLDAEKLTRAQRVAAVTALREVGFAAWVRTTSQGNWPLHIHAVAISDTDLATQAQKQAGAYYEGRNGLANNAADDGPSVTKVTYEEYLRSL